VSKKPLNHRLISAVIRGIGAVILIALLYVGLLWLFDALGGNQP
jgi:hypothetical protein